MKITRTAEQASMLQKAKELASTGCDKCLGCGRANYPVTYETFLKGLIWKREFYRVDHYSCPKCGCQYETDPYLTKVEKGLEKGLFC